MILRNVATATPQPWRNGGGVTRELLRLPAGTADDWTLRISVADIDADGPFSPFPGVTRWFAAIAGAGVRLSLSNGRPALRDVRPGDAPLRFDGADAPRCALLDGATRDLNVMVRRDRADALVTLASFVDAAEPRDGDGDCDCDGDGFSFGFGFFALQALVLHGADARPLALPALTLAWAESAPDTSRAWSIAPAHGAREHTLPGYWIRLLPPTP